MREVEIIRERILSHLTDAGFQSAVSLERSQFLNLPDAIFVELVLLDASIEDPVLRIVKDIADSQDFEVNFVVRSLWEIAQIGTPVPAIAPGGGLRAAVLLPVTLRSGSRDCLVTIAVTKLAEMELEDIFKRKPNLEELVRTYVKSFLRLGGQSHWNPTHNDYLEINANTAIQLSSSLRKSA